MAKEITNVLNAVLDHGRAFQREAPGNDPNVLRKAHRSKHFGTEHTRIANLGPLFKVGVVAEDLHRRLGVGIEGRLEAELLNTDLLEEGFNGTDEVAKRQVVICYEALYLMKLAKMRRIHGLVTENAIDGKVPLRLEPTLLIGELVEHLRRDGRRVRSEEILECFLPLEVVTVTDGAGSTHFVHRLDALVIVLGQ